MAGVGRPARTPQWLSRLVAASSVDPAVRNGPEAVRLGEAACSHTRKNFVPCTDALAAAYAEAGRFEDAVRTAERAAVLAREQGDGARATRIEGRLEGYRAGRPYREDVVPGE